MIEKFLRKKDERYIMGFGGFYGEDRVVLGRYRKHELTCDYYLIDDFIRFNSIEEAMLRLPLMGIGKFYTLRPNSLLLTHLVITGENDLTEHRIY